MCDAKEHEADESDENRASQLRWLHPALPAFGTFSTHVRGSEGRVTEKWVGGWVVISPTEVDGWVGGYCRPHARSAAPPLQHTAAGAHAQPDRTSNRSHTHEQSVLVGTAPPSPPPSAAAATAASWLYLDAEVSSVSVFVRRAPCHCHD